MKSIALFLTILAWVFLVLSLIRLGFLFFAKPSPEEYRLIRIAEMMGQDPMGTAIRRAAFVAVICTAWLLSRCL